MLNSRPGYSVSHYADIIEMLMSASKIILQLASLQKEMQNYELYDQKDNVFKNTCIKYPRVVLF